MNTDTNIYNKTARRVFSYVVFVLAILVLVASCPLKRFLHLNARSSINFQNERPTSTSSTTINYFASNCCSIKQKTVLVKAPQSNQVKLFQVFFTVQSSQQGFAIYNFLSRLDKAKDSSRSTNSAFPLYLQHRRLLV